MADIITAAPRMGRKIRSPQHSWNLQSVPFAVTPFMIAPVLPGETLKNAVFQARAVTVPIKNSLIGWWKEYYFFYVRLLDLRLGAYETMLVDQDVAPVTGASSGGMFCAGGAVNPYMRESYELIYDWYFRDKLDTATNVQLDVGTGSSLNAARVHGNSWMDSLHADSMHIANDAELVVGADGKFTGTEVEQLMLRYDIAKRGGLTRLTYDEWLAEQGVGSGDATTAVGKPELLRFVREWTYPANTVNAADGKVNSVCSWAVTGRIDKDRFFSEPGFIVGITVARPKVYHSKQRGNAAEFMTNMKHWMAGIVGEANDTTYQKFAKTHGPLIDQAEDYWIDFRDLFMYGDQFLGKEYAGALALPDNKGNRYPNDAMVASLFPDGSTKKVIEDGIVSLRIASRVRDPHQTQAG